MSTALVGSVYLEKFLNWSSVISTNPISEDFLLCTSDSQWSAQCCRRSIGIDWICKPVYTKFACARSICAACWNNTVCGSEKMDPKELLIDNINYRQLEFKNPTCALCEGGDFISRRKRFFSSQYKPTRLGIVWKRIRARWIRCLFSPAYA